MEIYRNTRADTGPQPRLFRVSAERPLAMLDKCPAYAPTPLVDCAALASSLGIASLRVKNEAGRMRLGSFKALGGAFAVAQMLLAEAEADLGRTIDPQDLTGDLMRRRAARRTFATASAGNHGLSVAAGARVLGARAVIFLAADVPEAFAGRIRALDADVVRIDGTYEDSVAAAIETAVRNGWQLLADGSWPGYIDPPALVMEGYTVLAEECRTAFAKSGDWPTHVVLQAGVGGLAAAVAAHIRETWPTQPVITIVEPEHAPCLLRSVEAGQLTGVEGPVSNMGRLDCKDASLIAFEALRRDADIFVTVSDAEAAAAADEIAAHGLSTTPSGAAGLAALRCRDLGLGATDRCLMIASEGPE